MAQAAADRWKQKLPELSMVGTENGYVQNEAQEKLKGKGLRDLQPNLIFVGLGVSLAKSTGLPKIDNYARMPPGLGWVEVLIFGLKPSKEPPNGFAITILNGPIGSIKNPGAGNA